MSQIRTRAGLSSLAILAFALAAGCGKDTVAPSNRHPDEAPNTELTFGPLEGDTVSVLVHFYWSGFDPDGQVVAFRWIVDPDSQLAKRPASWRRTTARDTTLLFSVDPIDLYRRHIFMVAAEDNGGRFDPTPAARWFAARTLPPVSKIDRGPARGSVVGPNFAFGWSGVDPDAGLLGPTVAVAPVDSFEYLLLRAGGVADTSTPPPSWHQPLPDWTSPAPYYDLIGGAVGDTLPYPHGDWRWIGIRGTEKRFQGMAPGNYVFAIRAVDVAGATEKGITANVSAISRHIRYFSVVSSLDPPPSPALRVNANVLNDPLHAPWPVGIPPARLQVFEGETISFSWIADAFVYGGQVVGYSYSLDDPIAVGASYDPLLLGVTLGPDRLTPGGHVLYVDCMDDAGGNTLAAIPILIVHPAFRDPGAPREVLYVDDSMAPGNTDQANGSFPSDITEDNFWGPGAAPGQLMLIRLKNQLGCLIDDWDTWKPKDTTLSTIWGRVPPTPKYLQNVTTVVWVADFQNTTSSPIGLWRTLVGGNYSVLAGYLRAGGTLVVTGYNLVNNSTSPSTLLQDRTSGLCASFTPGSQEWNLSYFPRLFMDVDYVIPNEVGRRLLGARDFVAAYPTAAGQALGFDTAYVDTGITDTGAKWNTNSDIVGTAAFLDQYLAPGLPRIEGWVMASSFGCEGVGAFGREDPAAPIARPIYTYHGVRQGITQDGGPSPREGLVCGILAQSHDLGPAYGGNGIYSPSKSVGRIVLLGFPLYFMKDQQASDALFSAFSYANGSPTLP